MGGWGISSKCSIQRRNLRNNWLLFPATGFQRLSVLERMSIISNRNSTTIPLELWFAAIRQNKWFNQMYELRPKALDVVAANFHFQIKKIHFMDTDEINTQDCYGWEYLAGVKSHAESGIFWNIYLTNSGIYFMDRNVLFSPPNGSHRKQFNFFGRSEQDCRSVYFDLWGGTYNSFEGRHCFRFWTKWRAKLILYPSERS